MIRCSAWIFLAEVADPANGVASWLSDAIHRMSIAALLSAVGIWLMLPGWGRIVRRCGVVLAVAGGAFFFSALPLMGNNLAQTLFWALAAWTTIAAVATITSRNPVYCAIWFALTLLGTGALFLVNGAQFLGVATVAVYAGAIVVTFLFVLMLSRTEGQAYYDRISWGALPSLFATVAGLGLVLLTSAAILRMEPGVASAARETPTSETGAEERSAGDGNGVLQEQHVAAFGAQLFSRHLVAVQAAGTLLLAALVGAVAIASAGKPGPAGRPILASQWSGRSSTLDREGGRPGE